MSARNVEMVRAAFKPWIAGRLDEFAALLDKGIEWDLSAHPLPDFPNTGSGRDAFLRHLVDYVGGWVDYRSDLVDVLDAGDEAIAVVHERAGMRDTGRAALD